MSKPILKSVYFKQEGEYQVIGKYRNPIDCGMPDRPEYEEIILDHGSDYFELRRSFLRIAETNNVPPFDLVSLPLVESLASIIKE